MRTGSYKSKKKRLKLIAFVLLIIVIIVFISYRIDKAVRPVAVLQGQHFSELTASNIISKCVYDYLEENQYTYNDFAAVLYDENGKVASIEVMSYNVNKVQSELTQSINDSLYNNRFNTAEIPIGSLTNSYLLSGKGPCIPLRICPIGDAGVKLTSRFSSAGLNQTCHRISAVINVNMESSLPLYTFSSHNEFEFLLSENIIVGAVPDGFITSSVF